MNLKTKNRKKGFSLVEALVAMVILIIGVVPVVTIARNSMLLNSTIQERAGAARVSQILIDYIRSSRDNNLDLTAGNFYAFSRDGDGFRLNGFADDIGIAQNLIFINDLDINLNNAQFTVALDANRHGVLERVDAAGDPLGYVDILDGLVKTDAYRGLVTYGILTLRYGYTDGVNKPNEAGTKDLITRFIITPN